MQSKTS